MYLRTGHLVSSQRIPQKPQDGLGRRRSRGARRARDWHTDQGKHTFDFILCPDRNLEAGKLN
jgi:hypothetical protein